MISSRQTIDWLRAAARQETSTTVRNSRAGRWRGDQRPHARNRWARINGRITNWQRCKGFNERHSMIGSHVGVEKISSHTKTSMTAGNRVLGAELPAAPAQQGHPTERESKSAQGTAPAPKPIPRWDVHFWGLEDDREDSTAPHTTFRAQMSGHRQCGLAICTFHLGFSLGLGRESI